MPFTLVHFRKTAVSATLLPLTPIGDPHVRVEGYDLVIPALHYLAAALCFGNAPTQCQIQSPSLRRIFLQDLAKMIATETCVGAVDYICDYSKDPLPLEASEKLNVSTIHTLDGACLIWLSDGPIAPVHGDIRTIQATTGHTTAADVWENVALTLSQTLPAGRYQVVGMRAVGTNLIAARLVFVGGTWRPGVPAGSTVSSVDVPLFRQGAFGVFDEFEFDQPPSIDLLGTGVTASEVIALDLIQIRAGR